MFRSECSHTPTLPHFFTGTAVFLKERIYNNHILDTKLSSLKMYIFKNVELFILSSCVNIRYIQTKLPNKSLKKKSHPIKISFISHTSKRGQG